MKDSMEEEVILDPYWFSGSPMEEDTIEETLLEEEDFCKKEEDAPTVQEIFAIAVTQEASSDIFPIALCVKQCNYKRSKVFESKTLIRAHF